VGVIVAAQAQEKKEKDIWTVGMPKLGGGNEGGRTASETGLGDEKETQQKGVGVCFFGKGGFVNGVTRLKNVPNKTSGNFLLWESCGLFSPFPRAYSDVEQWLAPNVGILFFFGGYFFRCQFVVGGYLFGGYSFKGGFGSQGVKKVCGWGVCTLEFPRLPLISSTTQTERLSRTKNL